MGDPDAVTEAERSFLDHAANRAVRGARTFATAVCGFATKEAVRQRYPRDTDTVRRTKTWRHHGSKNPRDSHAAMDGETVGLDERFSNGADYPGDLGLPAEETVNCRCTIDVGVERNPPIWMRDHNVSRRNETVDLPSGRSGVTMRSADCDIYTTQDGIEIVFPRGMDVADQSMTPEHAIELLEQVPQEIRTCMQRRIYFVDYENVNDPYWRRVYRNFTQSYATGGDEMVFYRWSGHDDSYVVRTFCHEAGHYIDRQNGNISASQEWQQAKVDDELVSGNANPTTYAANSDGEDFAESVALWGTSRSSFTVEYPNRTAIIERLI